MDKTPGEESVLGTADKGRTHSARKCIDLQDSDKNQMDTAFRLETKTITPAYTWDTGYFRMRCRWTGVPRHAQEQM